MTAAEKPGIIVAMPTRGALSIETHYCLKYAMDGFPVREELVVRKPIVEARNELARRIRNADDRDAFPFVLWIDDDAWWPRGTVERAVNIIRTNSSIAVLLGYASQRAPYGPPFCWGLSRSPNVGDERLEVYVGSLHWALMLRCVLDQTDDAPFDLSAESDGLCEDGSFCERINRAGLKMFCDPSIIAGHVNAKNGAVYFPHAHEFRIRDFEVDTTPQPVTEFDRRTYGEGVDNALRRSSQTADDLAQAYVPAVTAIRQGDYDAAAILVSRADKYAKERGFAVHDRNLRELDIGTVARLPKRLIPEPWKPSRIRAEIRRGEIERKGEIMAINAIGHEQRGPVVKT